MSDLKSDLLALRDIHLLDTLRKRIPFHRWKRAKTTRFWRLLILIFFFTFSESRYTILFIAQILRTSAVCAAGTKVWFVLFSTHISNWVHCSTTNYVYTLCYVRFNRSTAPIAENGLINRQRRNTYESIWKKNKKTDGPRRSSRRRFPRYGRFRTFFFRSNRFFLRQYTRPCIDNTYDEYQCTTIIHSYNCWIPPR